MGREVHGDESQTERIQQGQLHNKLFLFSTRVRSSFIALDSFIITIIMIVCAMVSGRGMVRLLVARQCGELSIKPKFPV